MLQSEQISKHEDIPFLISLGTNTSSISLRLDWHLCSVCLCFQVLYCTAPLEIKRSLELEWQVELSRTNLGSIEVHFATNSFFNFVPLHVVNSETLSEEETERVGGVGSDLFEEEKVESVEWCIFFSLIFFFFSLLGEDRPFELKNLIFI